MEGRLFAKYLVKHIEGEPSIIVQNMDGAGGLVGASYLGEVAPKDGTYIGYLSGTSWLYVSEPERWRVDFRSYEFVAHQPGTTVLRTDVQPGMRKPADIIKAKGLIAGGLSIDTSKDLRLRLGLDLLGVPFRYSSAARSTCSRNRRRAIARSSSVPLLATLGQERYRSQRASHRSRFCTLAHPNQALSSRSRLVRRPPLHRGFLPRH
jgi:hypothetical protein